jgi:hypothetical protein
LSESELHNLIYFCFSAKEYEYALFYTEQIKSVHIITPYDKLEIPYFVYEMIIYAATFPDKLYVQPLEVISKVKKFLQTAGDISAWIYESLAEFCVLYGFFDEARELLCHPQVELFLNNYGIENYMLEVLEAISGNEKDKKKAVHIRY